MLIMELALRQSLMVISTTDILLCTVHPWLSEPQLSGSLIIRTSQTVDYIIVNMCLCMRNLPTVMGVAVYHFVHSSCNCRRIVAVSFTKAKTKSKCKRKALSIRKDKVSIVKQLRSSSVAIIAEPYRL